jgi:hypothetical protein
MDDEKPVSLKEVKLSITTECNSFLTRVIHIEPCNDTIVKQLSEGTIEGIYNAKTIRQFQTDANKRLVRSVMYVLTQVACSHQPILTKQLIA